MEYSRFDALVKVLAVRRPRRALLPLIAALGFGLAPPEDAAAAKSGKCKPKCGECARCKRGDCDRKVGKTRCSKGKCKPKPTGTLCTGGSCQSGRCVRSDSTIVGPPGPPGPPGAGLVCPQVCPTCQSCNPVTGECVVNPRENGEPGTGCATPNVCCSGTCCHPVHACNVAGECATCAEVCEPNCEVCLNLAQGGTRCGEEVAVECPLVCSSSTECTAEFPTCVESITYRGTNMTLTRGDLCGPFPPGMGVCSSITPCQ